MADPAPTADQQAPVQPPPFDSNDPDFKAMPLPDQRGILQKWSSQALDYAHSTPDATPEDRASLRQYIGKQYDQLDQTAQAQVEAQKPGLLHEAATGLVKGVGSLIAAPGVVVNDALSSGPNVANAVLGQKTEQVNKFLFGAGSDEINAQFKQLQTGLDSRQPFDIQKWGEKVKDASAAANAEPRSLYDQPQYDPTNPANLSLISAYQKTQDPAYLKLLYAHMTQSYTDSQGNKDLQNSWLKNAAAVNPDIADLYKQGADPTQLGLMAALGPIGGKAAEMFAGPLAKTLATAGADAATWGAVNVAQTRLDNPNATGADYRRAGLLGLLTGGGLGLAHAAFGAIKGNAPEAAPEAQQGTPEAAQATPENVITPAAGTFTGKVDDGAKAGEQPPVVSMEELNKEVSRSENDKPTNPDLKQELPPPEPVKPTITNNKTGQYGITVSPRVTEALNKATDAVKNVKNSLLYGKVDKETADILHERDRNVSTADDMGTRTSRAMNKLIGNDEGLRGQVADALEGKNSGASLPKTLRDIVQSTRALIDHNTKQMIDRINNLPLVDALGQNIGKYLNRSYRIFDDYEGQMKYLEQNPKIKADAIKYVQNNWSPGKVLSTSDALGIVNGLLDRKNSSDFIYGRSEIAGRDVTSLIKRKDISPEIQALLGVDKDPALRVRRTLAKQARFINNHDAQTALASHLLDSGQAWTTPKGNDVELVPSAGNEGRYPAFKGLRSTVDFRDRFQNNQAAMWGGAGAEIGTPMKIYNTLTAAYKQAMVLANPAGYAPQTLGEGSLMLLNGRGSFTPGDYVHGWAEALRSVGIENPAKVTDAQLNALRQRLLKQGMLSKSAAEGLTGTMDTNNYFDKIPGYSAMTEKVGRVFGGMSNAIKVPGFLVESRRYAEAVRTAHPDFTPEQVQDEADRRAGEVMRGTSHYYENLPPGLKAAAKYDPFVTPFAAFPYVLYRATYNTLRFAVRDIKEGTATGNTALRNIGAKRLAAATATLGATAMMSSATASALGVDDKVRDALERSFVKDYDKREDIGFSHNPTADRAGYFPASYINPLSLITHAAQAVASPGDSQSHLGAFMQQVGYEFGGTNPLTQSAADILKNSDTHGKRIVPANATGFEPFYDNSKYFLGQTMTPGIYTWGKGLVNAAMGKETAPGIKASVGDSMMKLMGLRERQLNPTYDMQFTMRDAATQLRILNQDYNSAIKRDPSSKEAETQKTAAVLNAVYQGLFNLRQDYTALPGGNENRFKAQLKNAGFTQAQIGAVLAGKAEAPKVSKARKDIDVLSPAYLQSLGVDSPPAASR